MSAAEFSRWLEYFQRNGRCGPVRMFDHGPAMLAWKIDHAISAEARTEIATYLPFKPPVIEREPAPEDFMRELTRRK